MVREFVQSLHEIGINDEFMVFGSEALRHDSREIGFVKILLLETYGEGFYRPRGVSSHQGHHSRGIDAAAQKRSKRNVADQAHTNRFGKLALQFLEALIFGFVTLRAENL